MAVIKGTSGSDELYGTDLNDRIFAFNGNDEIYGNKGDDYIAAGWGDDDIFYTLGDGSDTIDGGGDTFDGSVGKFGDFLEFNLRSTATSPITFAAVGTDNPGFVINTATTSDYVAVRDVETISIKGPNGPGLYDLRALTGSDVEHVELEASRGADKILGSTSAETVRAFGGNDIVRLSGGDDTLFVGGGRDRVYLGNGRDNLVVSTQDGADLTGFTKCEVFDFKTGQDRLSLNFINVEPDNEDVDTNGNGFLDGGDEHVSVANGTMTVDFNGMVDGGDDGFQTIVLMGVTKIDMSFVEVEIGTGI